MENSHSLEQDQSSNLQIENLLYDKSYTCVLCGKAFTYPTIRLGKNQVVSTDDDLYTHYSLINPLCYDVICCPHCGYAALSKSLQPLLPKQKKWLTDLLNQASPPSIHSLITSEEAIIQHKMALLISIKRKGKLGEQAYLALHIAWLYRDLGKKDEEKDFLERAAIGFKESLSAENYPQLGLDEQTVLYLISAISFHIGNYEDSLQYLSTLLTSPGISARIKDRALDLKQALKERS